jgi:hypothetical protein
MAEEIPPPYVLPESEDEATWQLIGFLYLLMRDLVPPGYVESTIAEAFTVRRQPTFSNAELRDMAMRMGRQLMYTDPVKPPEGGP